MIDRTAKVAPIRLGISGLGRAFTLMLPSFLRDERVALVAAFSPGAASRQQFVADFGPAGARAHDHFAALAADPAVEAIYIASPHEFHAEQAVMAARAGKHLLVDKPIALTGAEAARMVDAAAAAGVHLIVGPSHSFDAPVLRARALIDAGAIGTVRQIQAMNYTDFLYRPRRPEELDSAQGGGVLYNQAVHQIDVVRLLAGSPVRAVSAQLGNWDPARPTEGAYAALLEFADGAFATLTYNGYGYYDSDVLMDWVGELGQPKNPDAYGTARAALAEVTSPDAESALKAARKYGPDSVARARTAPLPVAHEHFGFVLVSGTGGDLRLRADGVELYAGTREFLPCPPPAIPRGTVMDELYAALRKGVPPPHDGRWGQATLDVALAMLTSAREQRRVALCDDGRHTAP